MPGAPLGGMSPAAFLREHWQKRPLPVRAAYPDFDSPLDGDELAGLACDEDVESRIVVTEPGPSYVVRHGPFKPADFDALGEHPWTLLVQDVDKHLPDFAAWLDEFRFLPEWRLEDLMISWAADGGSVGPHTDQYDVFLLQAAGRRRWRLGSGEDWTLGPGDLLYLPPGVEHWGVADGACMTWSIGLRAPSARELLADFAERVVESLPHELRYADPDLAPAEADGRLGEAAVARVTRLLDVALADSRAHLPRWFGEAVTAPKAWLHCVPPEVTPSRELLAARLRAGRQLVRDPRSRMLWLADGDALCLCVDGESFEVPARLEPLLRLLCSAREFPPAPLARYLDDDQAMTLLVRLHAGGQLLERDDG